ncbi:hypothetical protein DCC85_14175 [Paenibacillus sp. CAA11]|uniref:hypothetical protein n=1 Tax=Paenibacillus sp. CAA11 TaxID=1532905 RepID=UPI000D3D862B|nr:hypothetical protein [Paenibacillus sp. CAA11]AWB45258.1 hypothetical protein DCC85_14175 [Paenibacillus sp. CAA11]
MLKSFAQLFYVAAAALLIFGVVVMYHYGDYSADYNVTGSKFGHIVEGDAYNYIINATRGVGIIVIGAMFAIVATALLIVEKLGDIRKAIANNNSEKPAQMTETTVPAPEITA